MNEMWDGRYVFFASWPLIFGPPGIYKLDTIHSESSSPPPFLSPHQLLSDAVLPCMLCSGDHIPTDGRWRYNRCLAPSPMRALLRTAMQSGRRTCAGSQALAYFLRCPSRCHRTTVGLSAVPTREDFLLTAVRGATQLGRLARTQDHTLASSHACRGPHRRCHGARFPRVDRIPR